MNRLTKRDSYGSAAWNGNPDFSTLRRYRALLDRIADYEDSGMEPDEIAELEGKKKFGLTPEDKHGK